MSPALRPFLVALAVACGGASTQPAATPAPPAEAPPAVPAAAPAAAPAGWTEVCGAGADRVFACSTAKGKEVVVCVGTAADPWVRYRFGPADAPELVFPAERDTSLAQFKHEERAYVSSAGNVLSFDNDGVTYEITEMAGAGGPDGEANNFAGVYVIRGGETIGTVPCAAAPTTDWTRLAAVLSPPSP
jgi:hypothetical protein